LRGAGEVPGTQETSQLGGAEHIEGEVKNLKQEIDERQHRLGRERKIELGGGNIK